MKGFVHTTFAAGVAVTAAVAITIVPPAPDPTPPSPRAPIVRLGSSPVQLSASAEPLTAGTLPNLLADWLYRIIVPPSAGKPFPEPEFEPVVEGNSIGSGIKNIYNAIEPWVQYGFELATYAVGWVPYVGWLSPQIMIFYHFGERIVRSITFNIADWLDGSVSFIEGLINVGVDTINSFIQLGIDQWNFWLPPLPPLPPLPLSAPPDEAETFVAASTDGSGTNLREGEEKDGGEIQQTPKGSENLRQSGQQPNEEEEFVAEGMKFADGSGAVQEGQQPVVKDDKDDTGTIEATTNSNGTVTAQGEIRTPGIDASKDDVTPGHDAGDGSGDGKPDEKRDLTEAQSAAQTPPSHDDGTGLRADPTGTPMPTAAHRGTELRSSRAATAPPPAAGFRARSAAAPRMP